VFDVNLDFVRYLVEEWVDSVRGTLEGASTIDTYLIKLSTLISKLEEFYQARTSTVLRIALGFDDVKYLLGPLANYIYDVKNIIERDPRHKLLRKYEDVIIEALRNTPPRHKQLIDVRPPLRYLEEVRISYGGRSRPPTTPYERGEEVRREGGEVPVTTEVRRKWRLPKKVITAVALITVLVVGYMLINTLIQSGINIPSIPFPITQTSTTPTITYSKLLDKDTVDLVGKVVFGSYRPSTTESVWLVLYWTHNNIKYSTDIKASTVRIELGETSIGKTTYISYIEAMHPREFLIYRSGRCIDYALFITTALNYLNIPSVYILTWSSLPPNYHGHAVAGVIINGTLFILDQRPPPIPYRIYVDFIVGGIEPTHVIAVFKDSNGDLVYTKSSIYSYYYTSGAYTIPKDVVYEGVKLFAKENNIEATPNIIGKSNVLMYYFYIPSLVNESQGIPIFKLYNSILRNEWVGYIKQLIYIVTQLDDEFRKHVREGNVKIWADIDDKNYYLVIYYYKT
jgi:hypothetical protein